MREEFPNIQGFSLTNLKYIRRWYLFYNKDIEKSQQAVGFLENSKGQQLVAQIPWGHNIRIISKCKSIDEALFYIQKTIEYGWSRDMLDIYLKQNEYKRIGSSIYKGLRF